MNNAAITVFGQITSSPITSLTISVLVSTWVRMFHLRADPSLCSYSYSDLVTRQQWWRIFTAPFCQTSFLSLLFNVITLWGMRSIEVVYGSWFVFRYSLLLVAVQGLLTTWVLHLLISYVPTATPFRNIATSGFSGMIISWLAYQTSSKMLMTAPFFLFGLIPLPWDLAPLFIILISPSFLNSKTTSILNIVSLFCGHMLSFGFLEILPDLYWSACFVLNIAAFLLVKSTYFHTFLVSLNSGNGAPAAAAADDSEVAEDVVEDLVSRRDVDGGVDVEMGRVDVGVTRTPTPSSSSSRPASGRPSPGRPSPSRGPQSRGTGWTAEGEGDIEANRGSGRFQSPHEGREEGGQDSGDEEEEGAFEGQGGFSEDSRGLLDRGSRR